jgi:predicted DNA binding CopG/RHH family protein
LDWDPGAIAAPSAVTSGFASLLAALATPKTQKTDRETDWNQDDPSDETGSLSYERALRANSRYERIEWPAALVEEAEIADLAKLDRTQHRTEDATGAGNAGREGFKTAAPQKPLKTASITIRLSPLEFEQLKERASEAGLSISAYLRSCTFEAEALRAQVKKALAELRAASLKSDRSTELLPPAPAPHRWWRLWQHSGARRAQA